MKYLLVPLLAVALVSGISGCGGQDRAALAKQTVQTYWSDIGHGKFEHAYGLLTSGVQAKITESQYVQSMFGLLTHTQGVYAKTGTPDVNGDLAEVPVDLYAATAPGGAFHVYQHLFWENGGWKISEPNGGVSQTK